MQSTIYNWFIFVKIQTPAAGIIKVNFAYQGLSSKDVTLPDDFEHTCYITEFNNYNILKNIFKEISSSALNNKKRVKEIFAYAVF